MEDKYKAKILDWLASIVNHKFQHHFSDKWVSVNLWDNYLSISLDFRQQNQIELFNLLPEEFKGTRQHRTNKLVNENILYFKIDDVCNIKYPEIISSKLLEVTKHQSGSGGWIDVGEFFYTYDWEVFLSDNTTIIYNNQKDTMDMIKGDYIYNKTIQEREFKKFLDSISNS